MTETYYYFDGQSLYQADWTKTIGKALLDGVLCGVYDDLFAYGDASGMQVKVRSGAAHIKGHFYFSDAEQTLAIAAAPATAGQSRYDLVVCEVNWSTKVMSVKVMTGTAGASPSMPSLTRSSTVWQIPLARVTVAYGDTNVAADKVHDMREWALGTYTVPLVIGNGSAVITTGAQPVGVLIPKRSKAIGYYLVADASGSIVIDLWRDTLANYPPTVADTICNTSYKPTLSSARTIYKTVWDEETYINENGAYWSNLFDVADPNIDQLYLLANVDSVSGIKQANLTLRFARMASPQS